MKREVRSWKDEWALQRRVVGLHRSFLLHNSEMGGR
jgi:hypothetical protein